MLLYQSNRNPSSKPAHLLLPAATKHLAGLVLNKTLTLQEYDHDRYSRILAVVYINGSNVSLEMIRAGLPEIYRGTLAKGFDNDPHTKAEKEAQDARRALWTLKDKYVSPKNWRRPEKNQVVETNFSLFLNRIRAL